MVGKMALASRAFLVRGGGHHRHGAAFAYVQRSFTPTIDLYFQTGHARLTKGMAVKLIGFNIGSLQKFPAPENCAFAARS
jgi:hypothetical protein